MQSIFVFIFIFGKNALNRKYKIDRLFADQCYSCRNTVGKGWGDPFDASLLSAEKIVNLSASGACQVCFAKSFEFC